MPSQLSTQREIIPQKSRIKGFIGKKGTFWFNEVFLNSQINRNYVKEIEEDSAFSQINKMKKASFTSHNYFWTGNRFFGILSKGNPLKIFFQVQRIIAWPRHVGICTALSDFDMFLRRIPVRGQWLLQRPLNRRTIPNHCFQS